MRELIVGRIGTLASAVAAAIDTAALVRSVSPPPKGTKEMRVLRSRVRLNRSRKWAHAETYKEARAMSPYPERPVR